MTKSKIDLEEIAKWEEFKPENIERAIAERIATGPKWMSIKTDSSIILQMLNEYLLGTKHNNVLKYSAMDVLNRNYFVAESTYVNLVSKKFLRSEGIDCDSVLDVDTNNMWASFIVGTRTPFKYLSEEANLYEEAHKVAREEEKDDPSVQVLNEIADRPDFFPDKKQVHPHWLKDEKGRRDGQEACSKAGVDYQKAREFFMARQSSELPSQKIPVLTFGDYKLHKLERTLEDAKYEVPIARELLKMGYSWDDIWR